MNKKDNSSKTKKAEVTTSMYDCCWYDSSFYDLCCGDVCGCC